ncbi:MAG: hypothetical protein ACO3FI_02540 [Cyclobacteriaceae bacterium]
MITVVISSDLKFRLLYYTGLVLLITGTIDPMEGSVLIAASSIIFSINAVLKNAPLKTGFLIAAISCTTGVIALFVISSFGGLGGKDGISPWWAALILPYPVAWLSLIVLLIRSGLKQRVSRKLNEPLT